MQVKDIYSQEKAVAQFQRAFAAGKTAHAYLFVGTDGVGKRTAARAFAKMLLCHQRQEKKTKAGLFFDSCGQCRSCKLFEAGSHPDYKPIYKELIQFTKGGKGRTTPLEMPIDVIREFLIDKASNKPIESDYVVYVIDEAEKVNNESQNAMLKVLEEPPAYCVIILLCSRLEEMLPTTQSRCQLIRFNPVEETQILKKLNETRADEKEALYWARFSEGSVGQALAWASLDLGDNSATAYAIKKELVDRVSRLEPADVLDTAVWIGQCVKTISAVWIKEYPEMSSKDLTRRAQKGMIQMILCLLADAMEMNLGREARLVNSDQTPAVKRLAKTLDSEQAAEKILGVQNMLRWVDASVNEKLIFEHLLLNLAFPGILSVLQD